MFFRADTTLHAPLGNAPLDYRVIVAVSLAISLWLVAIDPTLNTDAIIYLRAAEAYLKDGFLASQALFGRPLLSICFALIHKLTGIPLPYCALGLNALFYAILASAFVSTVRVLGGDRQVQFFAALVILSHPVVNDYHSSIVRDPPYWAFVMLAFRELLLYSRSPSLSRQLRWFVYIGCASLFRFEGLFFAALAPLGLLLCQGNERWRDCLRLLFLPLAFIAILLSILLVYLTSTQATANPFPGISLYVERLLAFPQIFSELSSSTAAVLLEVWSQSDGAYAALAGLAAILALNILRALTWPYAIALLWGRQQKLLQTIHPRDRCLINVHLAIALGYLALFTLANRFMLDRYASIFSLFLLLYVPFILSAVWTKTGPRREKVLTAVLLLVFSLDTLHNFNYRKDYIQTATQWLTDNVPAEASLISNNSHLAYFSGLNLDWSRRSNHAFRLAELSKRPGIWRDHDFLAVKIRSREYPQWQEFLTRYSLHELKVFERSGSGKVSIIEIGAQQTSSNTATKP